MLLKDVIHFYLGCRCVNSWFPKEHEMYNNEWKLSGVDYDHPKPYTLTTEGEETRTDSAMLILRPLSSMTEEELSSLLKKISLIDLSECEFEYGENGAIWCNAILGSKVVDSISYRHSVFSMMNNDGSFSPYNPQSEIFAHLLKAGFDLFQLIETNQAIDSTKL